MGITDPNMKRLFTFKYADDKVCCWGDAWEASFEGRPCDLKLEVSEVSQVLMMGVEEILTKDSKAKRPVAEGGEEGEKGEEGEEGEKGEDGGESGFAGNFSQDSIHALKLYKQFKKDLEISRRKYAAAPPSIAAPPPPNLTSYSLRRDLSSAPGGVSALFFDCDDCLYFDGWEVAGKITANIEEYCGARGMGVGEAYLLYKKWGTCLLGLIEEKGLLESCKTGREEEEVVDSFLDSVHRLPYGQMIPKNPGLREMLLSMDPAIPKWVFTASVGHHALNCLKALGVDDLFLGIIDTKDCNLKTKHCDESFGVAREIAGVGEGGVCVLFDDSPVNIRTAKRMGWRGVLVGRVERDGGERVVCEEAERTVGHILEVRGVMPELFRGEGDRLGT